MDEERIAAAAAAANTNILSTPMKGHVQGAGSGLKAVNEPASASKDRGMLIKFSSHISLI